MHCFSFASNLWIDWFTPYILIFTPSRCNFRCCCLRGPQPRRVQGPLRRVKVREESDWSLTAVEAVGGLTVVQTPSIRRMRGESGMKVWIVQDEQLREFVDGLWCCDWLQWRCDSDFSLYLQAKPGSGLTGVNPAALRFPWWFYWHYCNKAKRKKKRITFFLSSMTVTSVLTD